MAHSQASALYIGLFLPLLAFISWALHLSYPEPTIPALAPGQWMTRGEEEVSASPARPTGLLALLESFPLYFPSCRLDLGSHSRAKLYFMKQWDLQLGV